MTRTQWSKFATIPFLTLAIAASSLAVIGGCPFNLTPPSDGDSNCPDDGDPNDCDCNDVDPNTGVEKSLHEQIFTEILPDGYEGPESCLVCHSDHARDLIETGHWNWAGVVANIDGLEGETHGKVDLINNFCIAVPSNEGRCTMCHPGYGWVDDTFDFASTDNVDCLVCHDTTNTYRKHPTANGGGGPASLLIDGVVTVVEASELQEVAYNVGAPDRHNCGFCHYSAGGGDNVKHGDLASTLNNPTFEQDVHMDAAGLDFTCQQCHTEEDHGIAGMPLHSVDEGGASPDCKRCHTADPHSDSLIASLMNVHSDRIACQTCHIPTFARAKPTKVEWYWSEAGQDVDPIPTDEFGKPTYDKMKGTFVWDMNVKPSLMWYNGKWTRKVINVSDTYTEAGTEADPVVLAMPLGSIDDPNALIYPFKKMVGDQPADTTNARMVVPHLFGTKGGENPYWAKYDWDLAIQDGTTYTGTPYSGDYGFVNTVAYLTVNHEIAPASEALQCGDCHGVEGFFEALGYDEDPFGS